jgi:hypothetical protein
MRRVLIAGITTLALFVVAPAVASAQLITIGPGISVKVDLGSNVTLGVAVIPSNSELITEFTHASGGDCTGSALVGSPFNPFCEVETPVYALPAPAANRAELTTIDGSLEAQGLLNAAGREVLYVFDPYNNTYYQVGDVACSGTLGCNKPFTLNVFNAGTTPTKVYGLVTFQTNALTASVESNLTSKDNGTQVVVIG